MQGDFGAIFRPENMTITWKCCKCDEPASIYDVDWSEVFCYDCSQRIHQKNDEDHSLEPILRPEEQGVRIITPLMDELVSGALFAYLYWRVHVPTDYMTATKYCPWMEAVRPVLAHADPGALQLLQAPLHEACGVEDAFWRFFGDAWVRTIVTGTDTPLILLTSAVSVLCSDIALIYIMVPLISVLFTALMWPLHVVERQLPRVESLLRAEAVVRFMNLTDIVEGVPPVTGVRPSVASSAWDFVTYRAGRFFRLPLYYYGCLSERLQTVANILMFGTLAFRITCMIFGLKGVLLLLIASAALAALYGQLDGLVPEKKYKQAGVYSSLVFILVFSKIPSLYRTHRRWFCEQPPATTPASLLWRAAGRPELCFGSHSQISDQVFWFLSQRLTYIGRREFSLLFGVATGTILVLLAALPVVWKYLVQKPKCD